MAMPMGNAVMPKIKHFPAVVTGCEVQYQQQQQWFVDEREGFINWLRSEFATANAIIDCLCQHLGVIGESFEYDHVVGAIQQRRVNWNQVLIMQQYYSVNEVVYALQQVAGRRQQRPVKPVVKNFRKVKQWQRFDKISDTAEEKKDTVTNHQSDGILKRPGNYQGSLSISEGEAVCVNEEIASNSRENDSHSMQNQNQKENGSTTGKTFIGNEILDGKMVNVVYGLKLYEDLFDSTEVSELVSLVNDLRVAGRRGQLLGSQTYVVSRRPVGGHGREMIQLGVPIAEAPPDLDNLAASTKEKNIQSISSLFQDIIERMTASQVMTVKPDACIVDFYNEGDHSIPNSWPSWYGRPVYMIFLTEFDMAFGRTIVCHTTLGIVGALSSFLLDLGNIL